MRKPFIGGNWKMNMTISEAREFLLNLQNVDLFSKNVETVIFPPFTSLNALKVALVERGIKLGAQNMHWEKAGAFTGEISPVMLMESGCTHVILGHSERRRIFGEEDNSINAKVCSALKQGITPLLCIGESKEERGQGYARRICAQQLEGSLEGLSEKDITGVLIAYEPVWAIGTGENATVNDAGEMIAFIRQWLGKEYDPETAQKVRILYGGSVNSANAALYFAHPEIDGALIGGASLNSEHFAKIVKIAAGRKEDAI